MSDIGKIIELISRGTENFISVYYRALDGHRENIPLLFEPNAPIVYNGNPLMGGEAYAELYSRMPPTVHDVTGYDCHPLAVAGANGQLSIALTTSGKVRIGSDRGKGLCGFSETFILRPQPDGKFRVGSCGYRLVYRAEDDLEP
ncbi:hypothetical protein V1522DRAFT_399588 [Lipomyces starkeyi]|uniref:NTF2-related export protein n=1 Tax=Lipomyces starkeyi NRRL Y-11557 TaxID=675824 RepID=A0A1E3Q0Z8_LIPST|nr:hypothetical protein LIPSTDRAFT_73853 [Lipomyces starkeyi NRRL Y-11557]